MPRTWCDQDATSKLSYVGIGYGRGVGVHDTLCASSGTSHRGRSTSPDIVISQEKKRHWPQSGAFRLLPLTSTLATRGRLVVKAYRGSVHFEKDSLHATCALRFIQSREDCCAREICFATKLLSSEAGGFDVLPRHGVGCGRPTHHHLGPVITQICRYEDSLRNIDDIINSEVMVITHIYEGLGALDKASLMQPIVLI
ncbi:hypothetical protein PCL_09547 [Purpureocillium lilacinum]|uniref:Uncharacterized protein n=1 Tax=Purpureocillium lilacinum TaxID=33203 RepID=A0A2U3DQR5_PURLI|nr:hypothetical protein PCL_09547 [Purpureocillium lilacinum]